MKHRIPTPVWIFLPLLLGVIYALAYPLFAPEPDQTNMPPANAVLVFRYRDFVALDTGHVFDPPPIPWSEVIAAENNVPGLPGVDRNRPIYVIQLPPNLRHNSALVVFPVSDPAQFERAFMDPEMIERGRTRRPKELAMHGAWAAVGPDRDSVRRVGTGTLVCEDRGESWSVAADVTGLAALALVEARRPPWRSVLETLGVDLSSVETVINMETGTQAASFPDSQRLGQIVKSWQTARLWAYRERAAIEIELVPRPGSAVEARVQALVNAPHAETPPPAPPGRDAQLWIWIPGGAERALFQHALSGVGVDLPTAFLDAAPQGGALLMGGRAAGHPYAATIAFVTPENAPIDLSPLLGAIPEVGGTRALAEGEAPLTVIDTGHDRVPPAGDVIHRRAGGFDMVALGASTTALLDRMEAQLAAAPVFTPPVPPGEGWRLIAAFALDAARAEKVLGQAIEPGGLFAVLSAGPIEGALWTDGRVLRVTAAVVRKR